jgi:CheY-like chemotaxis protein
MKTLLMEWQSLLDMPRLSHYPAALQPPHFDRTRKFGSCLNHGGFRLENRCQVLIVDAADETRVVLQTALERLGLRTLAASQAKEGLALAQKHRPELIVLDLEIDGSSPDEIADRFASQSQSGQTSLVLLGTMRRSQPIPQGEYVAKPYHYGPLIRKIEEILSASSVASIDPRDKQRAG